MRKRKLYDPKDKEPFRFSRSKVEQFMNCPRCLYLDRVRGVAPPSGPPFSLNNAVDALLKNEFDQYRLKQEIHPLMKDAGIDAIPFQHEKIEEWRDALHKGITYLYPGTNLVITGGVDDLWVDKAGRLVVVDYKATSKNGQVSLDADWQISYKRQMSLYAWLFEKNGFRVSDTGYFVYCNGNAKLPAFNKRIEFEITVIPYKTDFSWIDAAIQSAYACLQSPKAPHPTESCTFCEYEKKLRALKD